MKTSAIRWRNGEIVDASQFQDVKAWVVAAVRNEDPRDPTRIWRGAPDRQAAISERLKAIKRENKNQLDEGSDLFIRRLEYCSREHRCFSGACPECGWLFQRALVRVVRRFIRENINCQGDDLVAISIIAGDVCVSIDEMQTFEIKNFVRRIKYALRMAGLTVAIGGIDFSFNEDAKERYEKHWCPHAYIVTIAKNQKRIRKALKKYFPADGMAIHKPIRLAAFKNSPRRISYAYKIYFERRITDVDKKGRRNTRSDRLLASQKMELAKYLG